MSKLAPRCVHSDQIRPIPHGDSERDKCFENARLWLQKWCTRHKENTHFYLILTYIRAAYCVRFLITDTWNGTTLSQHQLFQLKDKIKQMHTNTRRIRERKKEKNLNSTPTRNARTSCVRRIFLFLSFFFVFIYLLLFHSKTRETVLLSDVKKKSSAS